MIVFDLICADGHRFESWFASGAAYERQQAEGAVECPFCANRQVQKAPMAPRLTLGATAPVEHGNSPPQHPQPPPRPEAAATPTPLRPEQARQLGEALVRLREHLEAHSVDVGPGFPEEARRIHYGESEVRSIHGEASAEEAAALRDEGIEVLPLPWLRRRDG